MLNMLKCRGLNTQEIKPVSYKGDQIQRWCELQHMCPAALCFYVMTLVLWCFASKLRFVQALCRLTSSQLVCLRFRCLPRSGSERDEMDRAVELVLLLLAVFSAGLVFLLILPSVGCRFFHTFTQFATQLRTFVLITHRLWGFPVPSRCSRCFSDLSDTIRHNWLYFVSGVRLN